MNKTVAGNLRGKIPEFDCKDDCFDCCTPFLWGEWEHVLLHNEILSKKLMCKHLIHNRCSIYDERPIICRIFGASEDPAFQCPRGCGPSTPLNLDETKRIMEKWLLLLDE